MPVYFSIAWIDHAVMRLSGPVPLPSTRYATAAFMPIEQTSAHARASIAKNWPRPCLVEDAAHGDSAVSTSFSLAIGAVTATRILSCSFRSPLRLQPFGRLFHPMSQD